MNKTYALLLLTVLAAAPLALAHVDGGIYGSTKPYCEDIVHDKLYHDYGPNLGFIVLLSHDGSTGDGSLGPCPYGQGTENPWFDGHFEWASGGAFLVAADGTHCGWPYPDHPEFPTVWVFDHVLSIVPADVSFSVFADTLNNIPPLDPNAPNCGDVEADFGVDCVNHCTVGFPPGLDGAYEVQVNGLMGHVWTNSRF